MLFSNTRYYYTYHVYLIINCFIFTFIYLFIICLIFNEKNSMRTLKSDTALRP